MRKPYALRGFSKAVLSCQLKSTGDVQRIIDTGFEI
jgi:hypothetical protein